MNVFATDHPLVREPPPALLRFQKRLLRGFLAISIGYPVWLLLLGPYSAIVGTGVFGFLSQTKYDILFYPAVPVYLVPGLRSTYDDYLHWWYRDPNEADPETGWR